MAVANAVRNGYEKVKLDASIGHFNEGTLLVNNTSGSGTGTNYVAVNDGGTLGGTGFIFGSVTNFSGGMISPGSNGVGQLTLKSNLFLSAGSFLNFQLGSSSDKLVVSNALALNGAINVTNAVGLATSSGADLAVRVPPIVRITSPSLRQSWFGWGSMC